MNFSALVGERFSKLTPAQQLIARYIERNKERVAFMTAKQLAGAINVSDAAIVRFARALGYRGYTHLREDLGEALIENVGLSGIYQQIPTSSSEVELKEQVFANGSLLMSQTSVLNQPETVVSIAEKMVSARRIWVTAHGTTHSMAVYLAMQLNVLKSADVINIGVGDVADRIRHINQEDVFIGIGYERYVPYTIELIAPCPTPRSLCRCVNRSPLFSFGKGGDRNALYCSEYVENWKMVPDRHHDYGRLVNVTNGCNR
ncbi:MurR/RpiR family transcriptional regulator [Brenneria goodwinii]|nr:MurR/RpiR family transcriptional regulator [Brenneria goodwinii]MCG8199729.1 MurR/RpiR family transcriptional regulator [Brenneria goodwinii]